MQQEETKNQNPMLVERVTSLRTEGLTRKDIATRLNSENLTTPAGKAWTDTLVAAFMTRYGISKTKVQRGVPKMETSTEPTKRARKAKTSVKRKTKVRRATARKETAPVSSVLSSDQYNERFALFATIVKSDLMSNDQKIQTLNGLI